MSRNEPHRLDDGSTIRPVPRGEVPRKVLRRIRRGMSDGVTYSVNFLTARPGEPLKITAIHWRPGRRNELAACLISKVQGPMPVELDGHWYTVTPAEAPSWRDQGGITPREDPRAGA